MSVPQPSQTLPQPRLHRPSPPCFWGPVLPQHPQTGRQPHRRCSPPCRLSEVRPSRRRAAGKAQVLMMPAEWEGTTMWAFKHPCWVGARGSAGLADPRGPAPTSHCCRHQPRPPPCPTPHPSRVLTAGTGPHLAPRGSSTLVRGWGPGRRLSCSPASWRGAGGHPRPSPNTAGGERGAKEEVGQVQQKE